MNPLILAKIISILLVMLSAFMAVPLLIALYLHETGSLIAFAETIAGTVILSSAIIVALRKRRSEAISVRDGFLMVSLSWVLASVMGAMPFYISGCIPSFTDAFFETMSGFTTTGASILTDVESLPMSMLFWRSLTHWLGGMGIVVLTVAILPLMGIGGLQLIQAESPGPTVDRITPRIAETAKILWLIYILFTALQTLLLVIGGMNLFDSLTHSFGTMATGGFSTKNSSAGHFDSPYIEGVITVFMLLAGVNFTLHYRMLTGRFKKLYRDTELKSYLFIFFASTAVVAYFLYGNTYNTIGQCLRYASFQTASIMTTTGFATADFELWHHGGQIVLFMLMFIGGCSGSTGGGIKVIRLVVLLKQSINEIKLLLHPRGIFTLRISGNMVKKNIVYSISGFFFLYAAVLLFITFVVASAGHDITTSFTAALTTLGNIGPGFGKVGPAENFFFFEPYVKWALSFSMLVGRLEIYTVLVLFSPRFWRV